MSSSFPDPTISTPTPPPTPHESLAPTDLTRPTPDVRRLAGLFKLAADPIRLEILHMLVHRDRSVSVFVREFTGVAQQTMSRHIVILRLGGLVDFKSYGSIRIYRLTELGKVVVRAVGKVAVK